MTWKLTIKYSDGQTVITNFNSRDEAIQYLGTEDNTVSGFTLKENTNEASQPDGNSCS